MYSYCISTVFLIVSIRYLLRVSFNHYILSLSYSCTFSILIFPCVFYRYPGWFTYRIVLFTSFRHVETFYFSMSTRATSSLHGLKFKLRRCRHFISWCRSLSKPKVCSSVVLSSNPPSVNLTREKKTSLSSHTSSLFSLFILSFSFFFPPDFFFLQNTLWHVLTFFSLNPSCPGFIILVENSLSSL